MLNITGEFILPGSVFDIVHKDYSLVLILLFSAGKVRYQPLFYVKGLF